MTSFVRLLNYKKSGIRTGGLELFFGCIGMFAAIHPMTLSHGSKDSTACNSSDDFESSQQRQHCGNSSDDFESSQQRQHHHGNSSDDFESSDELQKLAKLTSQKAGAKPSDTLTPLQGLTLFLPGIFFLASVI
ncbi:MAG: hypothetical protein R6V52_04980 [Bacteroidales bacterium]